MHLLLVDDDALVLSSARRALSLLRPGWTLTEATSLPVALSLVPTLPAFDVIVCDLNLGADSGLDVLRAAMLAHPETLRVLLSGDRPPLGTDADLIHATVRKPVSLSELLKVIESERPTAPTAA
ncbi:MAG: response regulator [Gemmatimonadaceae bacterium]|nr:response regulator [Gemmatimonadaceae bacterium]